MGRGVVRNAPNARTLPRGRIMGLPPPPTMGQRAEISISPVRTDFIGRHTAQIQARRELFENLGDEIKKALEGAVAGQVARQHPTGTPPTAGEHPSTSVLETRRQYERLQAFLYAASFEGNVYQRASHFGHVRALIRANESILRTMARNPGQFGYPLPTEVQAVIVSSELAHQALGNRRETQAYMSAAPTGPSLSLRQFQILQRFQRDAAGATGLEVPKVEMLVRQDVRTLFEHLGFDYGVCYPNTPFSSPR